MLGLGTGMRNTGLLVGVMGAVDAVLAANPGRGTAEVPAAAQVLLDGARVRR